MTIVGWRLYFSDWFTAWMIVFVHLPDYPDYSFNIYKYQTKLINSKKKVYRNLTIAIDKIVHI